MRTRKSSLSAVSMALVLGLCIVLTYGCFTQFALATQGEIKWWLWHWDSPWQKEVWTDKVKLFEEQTGIKVTVETVKWDELGNKLRAAHLAGNPPDVLMILHQDYNWTQKAGYLMDITSQAAKDLDLDDFKKGALDSMKVDGRLYGLPWRRAGFALFYNERLLKEVGLMYPPNTLEEVKEYAQRITQGLEGVYGAGFALQPPFAAIDAHWQSLFYSCGGEWLNEDRTDVAPAFREAATKSLRHYRELVELKVVPPSYVQDTDLDLVRQGAAGKVAMWIDHLSSVPQLEGFMKEEDLKDIKYALFPEGKYDPETKESYRYSGAGGWDCVIAKDASNPEAAWEFVKFWLSSENMGETCLVLPARVSSSEHPRIKAIPEAFRIGKVKPMLTELFMPALRDFLHLQLSRVVLGKISPEEAADNSVSKIRELLKEYE